MPLRKFRYDADFHDADFHDADFHADQRRIPRAADGGDGFVASPVHDLHARLQRISHIAVDAGEVIEDLEPVYPGWFRICFPLAASGGLWVVIVCLIGFAR